MVRKAVYIGIGFVIIGYLLSWGVSAAPSSGETKVGNDGATMVWIPGGTFTMGTRSSTLDKK